MLFYFAILMAIVLPAVAQLADHPSMFKQTGNETALVNLKDYTSNTAWATLWHAETAYCLDYDDRNYDTNDYTKGFVFTYHIEDTKRSTEGYIGYQPDINAIIVSFRGSEDINNWMSNLEFIRIDYPLCSGCSVHEGFYHAEQAVYSSIKSEIQALMSKYPSYDVVLTGHSLGAALATLTALDLANDGIRTKLYNYGCPRMFNQAGADYASAAPNMAIGARRTHYKDIVVHTPMHSLGFVHTAGEVYETGPPSNKYPGEALTACNGEEDDNCADQWSITSISDHLMYSGLKMGVDGCGYIYPGVGQMVGQKPAVPVNEKA